MDTTGTPEDGGTQSWGPGEPVSDEYGYGTGYGYGPGYGDPGESGYGYGYGTPAPPPPGQDAAPSTGQADAPPIGGAAAGAPLPPVVGPTPALRGLPGGPGIEPVTGDPGPSGPVGGHKQAGGSMWQRSQSIWNESGIVWQRPVADWQPPEAEWERIESALTPPGRLRRGKGKGRAERAASRAARGGPGVPTRGGPGVPSGAGAQGPAAGAAPQRLAAGSTVHGPAAGVAPQAPAAGAGAQGPAAGSTVHGPAAGVAPQAPAAGAAAQGLAAGAAAQGPAATAAARRGIRSGTIVIGAVVVVVVAVLVVAGYLISGAGGGGQKAAARQPRSRVPVSPYPSAALATADFTTSPSLAARGVFQSLTTVASYGSTVVAAGSQSGTDISRAQFFFSTDSGRAWRLAPVLAADGGEPPAAHLPAAIVAGPAGWLAVGPGASWTSATGRSWQLAAPPGIPLDPGDQVLTVTATAHGFLAAGSVAPHGIAIPVVWTSPDGRSWQRTTAPQLRLPASGAVGAVVGAAAHGANTVIAAQVTTTVRTAADKQARVQHRTSTGLWQSTDGGVSWTQVPVPVTNGAADAVSGLASTGGGFVVVRPGNTSASGSGGVVYSSATGSTWSYAGTIAAGRNARLQLLTVRGSDQGAVIAATVTGGNLLAYRSLTGRSWRQAAVLANAGATTVSGLTVLPGGSVVAAGGTAAGAGSQGFLAVAAATRVVVDLTKIPGDSFPQLAVTAIAATPGLDVAVGSANGQPAVWDAPPGRAWSRAVGAAPAVFGRTGLAALTSVAAGSSGWLAVGGLSGGAPRPVVVFSPDGRTWRAADGAAAFAQAGATVSAAAARGSQYVAVGARTAGGRTIAAAWWSSGLGKWDRAVDARKGALDGKAGTRRMVAVTATSAGFVAIGQHGGLPAAWTSADGRAWRLIGLPAVSGGGSAYLTYVTASGNTVVAAGTVLRPTGDVPLMAVSADGGLTWREITVPVPGNPVTSTGATSTGATSTGATSAGATSTGVTLTGLTATGSGFVAVGTTGAPGRSDVVVLTSADGTAWRVIVPSGRGLSGPGAQKITALTAAGGKLLGAGFTATARTEYPTLWVAPPAPAVAGSTGAAAESAKPAASSSP